MKVKILVLAALLVLLSGALIVRAQDGGTSPALGPIVFASGSSDLYVINPDGSGYEAVDEGSQRWDTEPVWSPDAQRITFVGDYSDILRDERRWQRRAARVCGQVTAPIAVLVTGWAADRVQYQ